MTFCLNCGKEIPAGAKFCGNCGTPVGAPAGPAPAGSASAGQAPVTVQGSQPEGIRLLAWLSLLASAVVICLGGFLVIVSLLIGKAAALSDLGGLLVVLGVVTLVPRYAYINHASWGRRAGISIGIVYVSVGLLFVLAGLLMAKPAYAIATWGFFSLAFGATSLYCMARATARKYFSR